VNLPEAERTCQVGEMGEGKDQGERLRPGRKILRGKKVPLKRNMGVMNKNTAN